MKIYNEILKEKHSCCGKLIYDPKYNQLPGYQWGLHDCGLVNYEFKRPDLELLKLKKKSVLIISMPRNKSYYFDEEIAPLTDEEKKNFEDGKESDKKINKIYERTDSVIRLHKKQQKEEQKRKQKQKQLQDEEKRKKIQIQEEQIKTDNFDANYTVFKDKFYKLYYDCARLASIFEDYTHVKNDIKTLQKQFRDHCIHPEVFKCTGFYHYQTCDGGGSGFGSSVYEKHPCDSCELCLIGHGGLEECKIEYPNYNVDTPTTSTRILELQKINGISITDPATIPARIFRLHLIQFNNKQV